ncbi:hypothetical protein CP10139811_1554 [Chlamydia ibidis]|uniref:Uncharacterized protein n=1 Tax=Chlamydia ibidis TaxID=1405396 RepID=S7J5U5_9CHLA|nr:hypothetical protein CP10139811_1554 [Chlamydia ibidis]
MEKQISRRGKNQPHFFKQQRAYVGSDKTYLLFQNKHLMINLILIKSQK